MLLLRSFNPSLGRREKLPQKIGRKEKLTEKVGRREIYLPVPPPSVSSILDRVHFSWNFITWTLVSFYTQIDFFFFI